MKRIVGPPSWWLEKHAKTQADPMWRILKANAAREVERHKRLKSEARKPDSHP